MKELSDEDRLYVVELLKDVVNSQMRLELIYDKRLTPVYPIKIAMIIERLENR
jgi:hypothetical protein